MGLFGGKDDTKQKIEELKAKMQGGNQGGQPPQGGQQGWQPPQQQSYQGSQPYQPQQQSWQPPKQEGPSPEVHESSYFDEDFDSGIILDLGDGMSLNLPVKGRMRLDEFLRIADRVRELKKIEHQQHY